MVCKVTRGEAIPGMLQSNTPDRYERGWSDSASQCDNLTENVTFQFKYIMLCVISKYAQVACQEHWTNLTQKPMKETRTAYIGEHMQKLFTGEVGVVEALLAFDLLVRTWIAHKDTVLLSCQATKHMIPTFSTAPFTGLEKMILTKLCLPDKDAICTCASFLVRHDMELARASQFFC